MPSVITSTPAAKSSSAIFGVMPRPPAAFSRIDDDEGRLVVGRAASAGGRAECGGRARRRHRRRRGSSTHGAILSRRAVSDADVRQRIRGSRPARGREPPPVAAEPGGRPALDPARHAADRRPCALGGGPRRRPVLLIFIAAAIVALILNPLVTFFQRGLRYRAAWPSLPSTSGSSASSGSVGFLPPTRSPTRRSASSTTCRASSTTRTRTSPTCRTGSTTRAST